MLSGTCRPSVGAKKHGTGGSHRGYKLVLVVLDKSLGEMDIKLKKGLLWKGKEMERQEEDKKKQW